MCVTVGCSIRTSDCAAYFDKIDTFAFEPVTSAEKRFPLAFSFQVHLHIGILEMFLALYFRPTDSYCIHVDEKAGRDVLQAVNGILRYT